LSDLVLKAVAIRLLLVAVAIANGLPREKLLTPACGAWPGLQLRGLTLALAIFVALITQGERR
jgi:hypothetical protein